MDTGLDEADVLGALEEKGNDTMSAIEIARTFTQDKTQLSALKKSINVLLYGLKREGQVVMASGIPPRWQYTGGGGGGGGVRGSQCGSSSSSAPPPPPAPAHPYNRVLIGVDLDSNTQYSERLKRLTEMENVQCVGWQGPATNLPFEQWYPRMTVNRTNAAFNNAADFALAMDMTSIIHMWERDAVFESRKNSAIYVISKDKSCSNIAYFFANIADSTRERCHVATVTTPDGIQFD